MTEQFSRTVNLLAAELQKGWDSVQTEADWVSEEEAYRLVGIEEDHILDARILDGRTDYLRILFK